MRLKYTFETVKLDDQIIAVPVGEKANEFHGAVKLNDTAAFIFNLLKEDISEEGIISAMESEYEVDGKMVAADVRNYLSVFQEKGLLS